MECGVGLSVDRVDVGPVLDEFLDDGFVAEVGGLREMVVMVMVIVIMMMVIMVMVALEVEWTGMGMVAMVMVSEVAWARWWK